MSIKRIKCGTRMSQAVVANGMVFLSGQVAADKAGASVTEQTTNVLERIDALLAEAGTDKTRLLSATIWLTDIRTFDEMNAVWDAWLPEGGAPARATVEARLAATHYNVEIAVVAAL